MNEMKDTRRWELWLVVAVGCMWGLTESVGRAALHDIGILHHNGSILAGCAVLFFALAYGLTPRARTLMILPLIAMLFKVYLAGLEHHPIFCRGMAGNMVFAYMGGAFAFGTLMFVTSDKRRMSWGGGAAIGVLSTVIAANVFILAPLFTGQSACVVPGTALPSSVAGIPYAAAVAGLGAPLGFRGGQKLRELGVAVSRNGGRSAWPVGMGVAVACLAVVTLVHVCIGKIGG